MVLLPTWCRLTKPAVGSQWLRKVNWVGIMLLLLKHVSSKWKKLQSDLKTNVKQCWWTKLTSSLVITHVGIVGTHRKPNQAQKETKYDRLQSLLTRWGSASDHDEMNVKFTGSSNQVPGKSYGFLCSSATGSVQPSEAELNKLCLSVDLVCQARKDCKAMV